jgi:hypothetical protein
VLRDYIIIYEMKVCTLLIGTMILRTGAERHRIRDPVGRSAYPR